jgi:putative chitinase
MSYQVGDWTTILESCGVSEANAVAWAPYCSQVLVDETFDGGTEELAQFLGQALHESQLLSKTSENLNYTVAALLATFNTREVRITPADAAKFGRSADHPADQESIANTVYGGAWGLKNLGNKVWGDGWAYRGSGLIEITGFSNFLAAEKDTDIPFSTNPDLMRQVGTAAIEASVSWWHHNITVPMLTDALALRKRVNGPQALGLQDCIALTNQARTAIASVPSNP